MDVLGHLHKLVIGGSLAGTESWSISLHYLKANPGKIDISAPVINAIKAWFQDVNIQMNALARLDFVKWNELDPLPRINPPDPKTGLPRPASPAYTRYLSPSAPNEIFLTPGTIPAGTMVNGAPQLTSAVSLTTDQARGLAHKGRIYPPVACAIGADGRSTFNPDANLAAVKTMFLALNTLGAGNVVVYSGVRGTRVNVVNGLKIGKVVDTQRRRRRNLIEEYSYLPLA